MFYSQHKDEDQFLAERRQRQRQRALTLLAISGGSYATDFLTIALFVWLQVVTVDVLLAHGTAALIVNGIFFALFKSGYSLRYKDPNLARAQVATAVAIQLLGMWMAPPLAFMFLSLLFIVFTFGTLRFSTREAFAYILLIIPAVVAILFSIRDRLVIPHANAYELLLVGFTYCTTLLRCAGVGLLGGSMRLQLHHQNKQLREFAEKIEHMANYDELTGILNRRSICRLIDEQISNESPPNNSSPDETSEQLFIALLDLDHFKQINDRFGHHIGDEVLRSFTDVLQGLLRKNDRIGRYGGEEFLLLFSAESLKQAESIVDRVRSEIAARGWQHILPDFAVTLSAGIAGHRPGEAMRELIQRADIALYAAKHRGRNCVVLNENMPLVA